MGTSYTYKNSVIDHERRVYDYQVGVRLFYVVTLIWIAHKMVQLEALSLRSPSLIKPVHWYGKLIHVLPWSPYLLYSIAAMAIAVCIYFIFRQGSNIWLQGSLLFIVMTFNTLKLSLGYMDHVDHLFMLAHVFLLSYNPQHINALYVKYFQFGLLFTYTIAGLWKCLTLVVKLLFTSEMTWIHPQALYYQTYLFHEEVQKNMPSWMEAFLSAGFLPTVLVLTTIVIETCAVLALIKYRWLRYYLLWILAFHLFNLVFFGINFQYAALTACCFLFPFSALRPSRSSEV
ncbi:MAG TPA: hypothetical protein VL947_09980 [Cytophagales bacterium]|nr:hypothetical protein [Cytophagales bacterium]